MFELYSHWNINDTLGLQCFSPDCRLQISPDRINKHDKKQAFTTWIRIIEDAALFYLLPSLNGLVDHYLGSGIKIHALPPEFLGEEKYPCLQGTNIACTVRWRRAAVERFSPLSRFLKSRHNVSTSATTIATKLTATTPAGTSSKGNGSWNFRALWRCRLVAVRRETWKAMARGGQWPAARGPGRWERAASPTPKRYTPDIYWRIDE